MMPSNYIEKAAADGAAAAAAEPAAVEEATPAEAEVALAAGGVQEWTAQYDYTAADEDELSFEEDDVFTDIVDVDDGWVKGTHVKTGKNGLLPSNYVEKKA
jgi:hypothetical protein